MNRPPSNPASEESPRQPVWLRATPLVTAAIGLLCSVLAWLIWSAAPATRTSLDMAIYDRWVKSTSPPVAESAVILIARDAAAEARFGAGPWDRALIARLIGAVHDGGAAAIGVDLDVLKPSPPQLGGPAGDAQLAEAVSQAGNVIFPLMTSPGNHVEPSDEGIPEHGDELLHKSWPALASPAPMPLPPLSTDLHALPLIAHQAMGIGQVASLLDPDRSARRAPLVLGTNHRAVPAFGLLLAAAQAHKPADRMEIGPGLVSLPVGRSGDNGDPLTIPTDAHGALLTHDPGDGRAPQFPILSFEDIWASIEKDDPGRLRPMLEGKAVVMFPNPASPSSSEPAGMAPDTRKQQLYLLNTLLTAHWTRVPAGTWSLLISVLLAGPTAWATLRGVGWTGPAAALGIVIGYLAVVALLLYAASWIAPVAVPATAGLIALGAALAWDRFATAHRLRWLEQERRRAEEALLAVREALALRESAVDALEEDLDAARYTAAQSAGQQATLSRTIDDLRRQAEEARAQEADARAKLAEAERTVQGLQSSEPAGQRLNDGDLDRYRQDCQSLGIITQDPAVLGLFRTLKKAARSSLPILLLGQPGTGKELFARAAHRLSPRAAKPFIAVNMAAVSPELFESEIFGHRRGSFTGAVADRKGLFELAHQGTLFLDEIGDLRLDHQSKLLRVLQDKTFYRVGATAPTTVDVRIVAATNKDLRQGVAEGWFREDLYFRLQGLVLSLPPLRHRRGDIPLLAQALVRTFGTQAGRTDLSLSRDAVEALSEAPWEGNVRELAHVLEQAVALTDGPRITKADLRLPAEEPKTVGAGRAATILPDSAGDAAVLTALQAHRFDMQAAARALDWDRSTVTHRLKGLGFQALVEAEGDLGRAARALAGHPSLVRVVELKLKDYYDHLIATIQDAESPHAAIAHCRRRFKNLPDRHFKAVERLIERHFTLQQIDLPITRTPATH